MASRSHRRTDLRGERGSRNGSSSGTRQRHAAAARGSGTRQRQRQRRAAAAAARGSGSGTRQRQRQRHATAVAAAARGSGTRHAAAATAAAQRQRQPQRRRQRRAAAAAARGSGTRQRHAAAAAAAARGSGSGTRQRHQVAAHAEAAGGGCYDRGVDLSDLYAAHVRHLIDAQTAAMAAAGVDVLVLHAGSPALKDRFDDQHHPLRPTPAFAHWVPVADPDALVILRAGARPRLIRPRVDDFWEAPPAPPPDWVLAPFDVATVDAARIAGEIPAGRRAIVSSAPPPWAEGDVNPPALLAALEETRTRKTEYERECLAEASRRAVRGHLRAADEFAGHDASELALHLAYLAASEQDAIDTPYQNIVALGEHAAVLHFVSYQRRAPGREAQSLLVDAGASFLGYGSDITRTHVRGRGAGADLFRALVARVDAFQQELIQRIRPGTAYEQLHDLSHELLAVALVELGIGRGSAEALVVRGVTRALYPHGLGHSLGIQVHDVGMKRSPPRPDNPFLRNTSTIAEGQVFTIEPGCYVIDPLLAPLRADDRRDLLDWAAIDALRRFGGVRIEDDVAVVAGGVRDFTREAFDSARARA